MADARADDGSVMERMSTSTLGFQCGSEVKREKESNYSSASPSGVCKERAETERERSPDAPPRRDETVPSIQSATASDSTRTAAACEYIKGTERLISTTTIKSLRLMSASV